MTNGLIGLFQPTKLSPKGGIHSIKGSKLTHGFQLGDQFFFGPFFLFAPKCHGAGDDQFVVVGIGNIQVVDQHDIRILSKENGIILVR